MRTALFLAVIALVVLAALNPSMDDFEVFAAQQSELMIEQETGDDVLGSVLGGAAGSIVERYINRVAERENYLVFSTYTVDLDGPEADEEEWRFLGLAGRFFPLEEPASVSTN